jgi:hypothetical protein
MSRGGKTRHRMACRGSRHHFLLVFYYFMIVDLHCCWFELIDVLVVIFL